MKKSHKRQITIFSGVCVYKRKVLMVLRDEEECEGAHLKWELPGGKVDFNETPQEALKREFLEETGIEVEITELLPYVATNYWKYDWGTQQTLCFVFQCKYIKKRKKTTDHHVKKVKWIEIEKVKNLDSLPGTNEILNLLKKD